MAAKLEAVGRTVWPLVALLIPLVVVATLLAGTSENIETAVIGALINLIIVVGLYVFIGNSGVASFGHIGFVAIGAYMGALLTISEQSKGILLPDLPHILAATHLGSVQATLVAGAFVGLLAVIIGLPIMRLNGIAASIATLSLLVIAQVVLENWDAVTGGQGTLTGLPVDTTLNSALVWACIVCTVAYIYQRSRSGLRLRAARDDEPAARSLGIRVRRERIIAFALSAAIVGIGGSLYGHFVGSLTPTALYLQLTFTTLAMLVVGGIRSLSGAVLGSAVVAVLYELVTRLQDGRGVGPIDITLRPGVGDMLVAALVILILFVRPSGLTGSREVPWPRRRAKAASTPSTPGDIRPRELEPTE